MRAVFAPALVMLASLAPVSPHDACDPLSHASPLPTTCPVPTPTLSFVQDRLRRDFREKIASITVDPERDTPDGHGRRENGDVDHTLSPRSSMRAVFCGYSISEKFQRDPLSLVDEQ